MEGSIDGWGWRANVDCAAVSSPTLSISPVSTTLGYLLVAAIIGSVESESAMFFCKNVQKLIIDLGCVGSLFNAICTILMVAVGYCSENPMIPNIFFSRFLSHSSPSRVKIAIARY